jgi:hypothetical protein
MHAILAAIERQRKSKVYSLHFVPKLLAPYGGNPDQKLGLTGMGNPRQRAFKKGPIMVVAITH